MTFLYFQNSKITHYNQFVTGLNKFSTMDDGSINKNFLSHKYQLNKVASDKHVYVTNVASKYDLSEIACDITTLDKGLITYQSAYALPKGSPLLDAFSIKQVFGRMQSLSPGPTTISGHILQMIYII